MPAIPASEGWGADDWRQWFGVLLDQVRNHLKALERGEGDPVIHVHESRKILKRIRAGTRLLREGGSRGSLRALRLACRDAGRLLSASRDGSVRRETFEALLERLEVEDEELVEVIREALAAAARKGEARSGELGGRARVVLKKAAECPEMSPAMGRAEVQRGLRRMLKRARIDFLDLRDGRSEEFHELRKRVKDLYYALGALPADAGKGVKDSLSVLKRLSDTLGEENDTGVLLEWFGEVGFGRKKYRGLWKPFEKRRVVLRRRAMKEGEILESLADAPLFRKAG